MTTTVTSSTSQYMISATLIRQVLDKFLKAETVKSARIQVRTSDGVYHDIKNINSSQSLKLLSSYSTDYIFVSWPKILKEKILEIQ